MTIYRPGQRLYYPSSPGVRVVQPGGAAIPWYLSGGIAAANCIAAYTPKGSSSLAASYDNNAAPGNGLADGTYDAALGVAPTWDAATGWSFDGSQVLNTGVEPAASGYAIAVRVSGVPNAAAFRVVMGQRRGGSGVDGLMVRCNNGVSAHGYIYQAYVSVAAYVASGVYVISGNGGYLDGLAETEALVGTGLNAIPIAIGANNQPSADYGWTPGEYAVANVQAAAIYNVTLTAPQVAAVSAAMAAL